MAFAQQQWLHERSLMLRYTYITCPVSHKDESYTKCSKYMTNKRVLDDYYCLQTLCEILSSVLIVTYNHLIL